jgi:uncharacterized protein
VGKEDPLQKIKQIIVETCRPDQIYIIRYGSVYPDFSIIGDFLVLTEESYPKTIYTKFQRIIENGCSEIGTVAITFERVTRGYKLIEKGNLLYTRICQPENLIHDSRNTSLPALPKKQRIQSSIRKAKKIFEPGFAKAQAFHEGARYYLAIQNHAMVAFMLREAAAQAIVAFVAAITGQNPSARKLTGLLRFTRRITDSFFDVFPQNSEQETRNLQLLTRAYITPRTKNAFAISDDDTMILFQRVNKLLKKAKMEFETCLEDFERWWHFITKK